MPPAFSLLRSQACSSVSNRRRPFHPNPILLLKFFHAAPTYLNRLLNITIQETKNARHATQIHAQLLINNYTSFPFLFNNLINLYAICGELTQSLLIFFNTHNLSTNIVTWTTLITRLSHSQSPFHALTLFNQLRRTGILPNQFTFSAILPACANTLSLFHGQQMHSLICKHGFNSDIFVGSALIDMYSKCSDMELAKRAFDEMPEKNLVTWNAMIVGLSHNGLYDRSLSTFKEALADKYISPDQVTFSSALSSCANLWSLEFGRQVHGIVMKHGLISLAYVKNSLVDMYGKCGCFEDADKLFRIMEDRDVVTWNVMVTCLAQDENFEQACNYFWVMRREGISPDVASFSTVLHAATNLAAMGQGTSIHNQIIKTGFTSSTCVLSSLISMYAKCGSLADAHRVFEEIDDRTVVCWTAMIAACQQHGCADQVIKFFDEMLVEGIKPDYIIFVCALSACSHAGRIEEGFYYFDSMTRLHDVSPGSEHYACMVDMLSRSGRLDEAKRFIESMPMEPDPSVWGALLAACRNYGNIEMGKEVAEKLFEMEPHNPGNYVLLSNMYTRIGKLQEANEVRRLMGVNGVRKKPGCSWIDVQNTTYVFTAHDKSHSQTDEIYEILRKLKESVRKKGYIAETQFAVNDVESHKEQNLWCHSEKLALAFGLLNLPGEAPIRIKKNLRTCGDCHTVMKYASEIFDREIIVRDINRFHRFTGGLCSCGDYW